MTVTTQLHLPAVERADALADAIDDVVNDFCACCGWDGEFTSLSRFWVAPASWRDSNAMSGHAASFALGIVKARGFEVVRDDQRATAALTGIGGERAASL